MDSKWVTTSFFLLVVLSSCTFDVHGQSKVFSVIDFGAKPDGQTDNSKALLSAWSNACKAAVGTALVPSGIYLVSKAIFEGPCNGQTKFSIEGTLKASSDPSLGIDDWITFNNINHLAISGNGKFDGQGASTWPHRNCPSGCSGAPVSLRFNSVSQASVRGITSENSKTFHINLNGCDNMTFDNIVISAPGDSPNTDGIHIGNSNNIAISNSHIGTGDDCVSLGAGSTNINITGVTCGPGHGISIGSLGLYQKEAPVSRITVKNCTFLQTQNGLRIKTWAPSTPNTVSNITFEDVIIKRSDNPIIIDQFYCPHGSCSHQGQSNVQIIGVKFINVRGNSTSEVGANVQCSSSMPCQGIEFKSVYLYVDGSKKPTTASCSKSANVKFEGDGVPSHC